MKINKYLICLFGAVVFASNVCVASAFFNDVDTNSGGYEAVKYLFDTGVVRGYESGDFVPDREISYAEFIKILFGVYGYDVMLEREGENPLPGQAWFENYLREAENLGLNSYGFEPGSTLTRLQALEMIFRFSGIPYLSFEYAQDVFKDEIVLSYDKRVLGAAAKGAVFIKDDFPFFYPDKVLTRGAAAELIYRGFLQANRINAIVEADAITFPQLENFLNIWTFVSKQFIGIGDLNRAELLDDMIKGFAESLNDKYTFYKPPGEASKYISGLGGEGVATGIKTQKFDDDYIITGVLGGSSADKAGIKYGDLIVELNGKVASDLSEDEFYAEFSVGGVDEVVNLKVNRGGENMDFELVKEQISIDPVQVNNAVMEIPADTLYVNIVQFTPQTGQVFSEKIGQISLEGLDKIILDLRGNFGGYIDSVPPVLGLFIPEGENMYLFQTNFGENSIVSKGDGRLGNMNCVVLIDSYTASAAEITAEVLKVRGCSVLGEASVGKRTAQNALFFSDGALFQYSNVRWSVPGELEKDTIEGIDPDIVVVNDKEHYLQGVDNVLLKALELK